MTNETMARVPIINSVVYVEFQSSAREEINNTMMTTNVNKFWIKYIHLNMLPLLDGSLLYFFVSIFFVFPFSLSLFML